MRLKLLIPALFLAPVLVPALSAQQDFTDPVALLKAVAKTYATGNDAGTFHLESISESIENNELQHDWRKTYLTAIATLGPPFTSDTSQLSKGTQ